MTNDDAARRDDDRDDRIAVEAVCAGDRGAFESIVDRYTGVLYSLAFRFTGRQEDAEDAVQEILLKAYDKLDRFESGRRFYPWLYAIAVNHLRNVRGKHRRRGDDQDLPYEDRVPTGEHRTPLADPERELESREELSLVQRAIDSLPSTYREVLILRQIQELSVSEVAEILQMPDGTVKTNLHRARKAFAAALAGQEGA